MSRIRTRFWRKIFRQAAQNRHASLARRERGDPPSPTSLRVKLRRVERLQRGWQTQHYFGGSEFTIFSRRDRRAARPITFNRAFPRRVFGKRERGGKGPKSDPA